MVVIVLLLSSCGEPGPTPKARRCEAGNWKQVSVSHLVACGVHLDGCVECWGNEDVEEQNYYGGYDYTGDDQPPEGILFDSVAVFPGNPYEVSGGYYSCGVGLDQELYCWGDVPGTYPSVGLDAVTIDNGGRVGLTSGGAIYDYDFPDAVDPAAPTGRFVDVDQFEYRGWSYTCALDEAGVVHCWDGCDIVEGCIPPSDAFRMIDLGDLDGCGITTSAELKCWGEGGRHLDEPAPGLQFQTVVEAIGCGLLTDGSVWCGIEGTPSTGTFIDLSGSGWQACAISTDHELVCWGHDKGGVTNPPP